MVCGSLDFEEESEQLSGLVEEISVLYEENRSIVRKIEELNANLENFDNESKFYEGFLLDDVYEDEATANAEELWRTCQEELTSLEKDIWLQKEAYLREQLMKQLLSLSQDLLQLISSQGSIIQPNLTSELYKGGAPGPVSSLCTA